MTIRLTHDKFISNGRIYRAGDVLPDTETTKKLVEIGVAELVKNTMAKSVENTKKSEADKSVSLPLSDTIPENAKSDS